MTKEERNMTKEERRKEWGRRFSKLIFHEAGLLNLVTPGLPEDERFRIARDKVKKYWKEYKAQVRGVGPKL